MFARTPSPPARRISTPGDPIADLVEPEPMRSAPAVTTPVDPTASDTVTLSQPYDAFGEAVTTLKFRRPLARDIQAVGKLPFKFDVTVLDATSMVIEEVHTDWNVLPKYIPLLAEPAVTPATVERFTLEDLDACAVVLAGFFMTPAAVRMRLTPPTGSPGSTT